MRFKGYRRKDNKGSLVPDKSELGPEKGGDVTRFNTSTSWGRILR